MILPLAGARAAPNASVIHLAYAVYLRGFRAMVLDVSLRIGDGSYDVGMQDHTVGFVGALVENRVTSRSVGSFAGPVAQPRQFVSSGYSRGANRQTVIDYQGETPVVRVLLPAEPRRDPVPAALTQGSIDTMSAVAALFNEVSATGRCDARLTTFDGARLTKVATWTVGHEVIEQLDRSPYAGAALRCDFTTELVAGFLHDENFAISHQRQGGSVWIASVRAGAPPVPIRAHFISAEHGPIGLFLTGVTTTGG